MKISLAYQYFLMHLEEMGKSPHTIKNYRIDGKRFMEKMKEQGVEELDDQLRVACQAYRKELLASTYTNASCNRKISSLRSFLKYVHAAGWYTNDYQQMENVAKHTSSIEGLNRKEQLHVRQFYASLCERLSPENREEHEWMYRRNHAMLQVLWETGMLPKELIQLKRGHVQPNILFLPVDTVHFREIRISHRLTRLLETYIQQTECRLERELTDGDFMWFGSKHSPNRHLNIKAVERIVRRAFKEIGSDKTAQHIRYHRISVQQEDYEMFGYSRKATWTDRMNRLEK